MTVVVLLTVAIGAVAVAASLTIAAVAGVGEGAGAAGGRRSTQAANERTARPIRKPRMAQSQKLEPLRGGAAAGCGRGAAGAAAAGEALVVGDEAKTGVASAWAKAVAVG